MINRIIEFPRAIEGDVVLAICLTLYGIGRCIP
jgi:hypothetical protein